MHFPMEVWRHIMSHFHSTYRHPMHYDAITTTDDFNYNIYADRVAIQLGGSTFALNSYYAHIIVSNWFYWKTPDELSFVVQPQFTMRRGVATGDVRDEFLQIWKVYRENHNDCHILVKSNIPKGYIYIINKLLI